ncbi:hypothetical protein JJV70_07070 [Streptomyces sp. JJ66]|uniref:hypothetical protein n=1 Tax=Streptomyces sp. JJ66 TaxID=2803843 RepID=UPI001C5999B9|nr:hypothetical protein [Streptomyces sp. JJ66]MBW1601874.1 hypothetical protein [Streptomyces sp. JJ66]
MSFDEEWAQIVANVQERQAAGMRLNTLDPGGGSGDLTVHQDDLGRVGGAAYSLHGGVRAHAEHASQASRDAATHLTGDNFTCGSALSDVVDTWERQSSTLAEACAHISNHLDYSSKRYGEEEEKITTSMTTLDGELMNVSRISEFYK